jgi:hypothetical protein
MLTSKILTKTLVAAAAATLAAANDPAGSWLSYAAYTDPGHGIITTLNTTWTVPSNPKSNWGSNAPGWWFGIQTAAGDGALIQPILAWGYQGAKWSIFNACFDWTDGSWRTSDDIYTVSPGDKITSGITYQGKGTYVMTISANGQTITTPYTLESGQTKNESTAYFVLEHQPSNCKAYPSDGSMSFDNIYLEVDNKQVKPTWSANQEQPACNSKCKIVDDKTITFTWDPSTTENQPQPPLPAKWGFGNAPSFRKD